MDIYRIKQFVKRNGDKFVIVEDGEPEMVVMSFQEYEKMALASAPRAAPSHVAPPEKMRQEKSFNNDSWIGAHVEGFELFTDTESALVENLEEAEITARDQDIIDSRGMPLRLEDIRPEDLPI